MATLDLKESDLVVFDHVAAGHDGVMSDASGALVVKPCTTAELAFYESARAGHAGFASFMPTFMGTVTLGTQPAEAIIADLDLGGVTTTEQDPSRGKKIETKLGIALENVTAGFVRPNVLDVKLGAQLWDPSASESKRERLGQVALQTTSSTLGFRIAGMRLWTGDGATTPMTEGTDQDLVTIKDGYKIFGKWYGRRLTADDVSQAFDTFLAVDDLGPNDERRRVTLAERLLDEVGRIRRMLEDEESRMYGTSILFVYEGDPLTLEHALDEDERRRSAPAHDVTAEDDESDTDGEEELRPKLHAVKLVDFAHASWSPGQGPDENALRGMRSVERILADLAHR